MSKFWLFIVDGLQLGFQWRFQFIFDVQPFCILAAEVSFWVIGSGGFSLPSSFWWTHCGSYIRQVPPSSISVEIGPYPLRLLQTKLSINKSYFVEQDIYGEAKATSTAPNPVFQTGLPSYLSVLGLVKMALAQVGLVCMQYAVLLKRAVDSRLVKLASLVADFSTGLFSIFKW